MYMKIDMYVGHVSILVTDVDVYVQYMYACIKLDTYLPLTLFDPPLVGS